MRRSEGSLHVGAYDAVPFAFGHVGKNAITQDAGVIDHDVEPTECLHCLIDQPLGPLPVGHVVPVRDGRTAGIVDLGRHLGREPFGVRRAVDRSAEVVHHDQRPVLGKGDRVSPTDAAPGTRYDTYPPFTQLRHVSPLSRPRGQQGRQPTSAIWPALASVDATTG